jgi:hypothetical protein
MSAEPDDNLPWHVYAEAYETVYAYDVRAPGPEEAALKAAEVSSLDLVLTWTVVPGHKVARVETYPAVRQYQAKIKDDGEQNG